jgi:hypothetical protein
METVDTGPWAIRRGAPDGADMAFVIARLGKFPLAAIARMCGRSLAFVESIAAIMAVPEVPPAVVPVPKAPALPHIEYGACKVWRKSLPAPARAAVQAVADRHGVTYDMLVAPSWDRGAIPLCHMRQEAYFECYEFRTEAGERRYSMPLIGTWFGGRDHATVLHGIRAHKARLRGEKYVQKRGGGAENA